MQSKEIEKLRAELAALKNAIKPPVYEPKLDTKIEEIILPSEKVISVETKIVNKTLEDPPPEPKIKTKGKFSGKKDTGTLASKLRETL